MKIKMISAFMLAAQFACLGLCLANQEDVKIDQTENRMKAIIPAEDSAVPERGPNMLDRAAGAVGHSFYYASKATVEGVGKGADAVVDCVRRAGRSIYGWISGPVQNGNEK